MDNVFVTQGDIKRDSGLEGEVLIHVNFKKEVGFVPGCLSSYRGISCTRNRDLTKRTGFDHCVFLIEEEGTDQILPSFR